MILVFVCYCVPLIDDIAGSYSLIVSLKVLFPFSYAIILLLCAVGCAVINRVVGDALPDLVFVRPPFVLLLTLVVGLVNGIIHISPASGTLATNFLSNLEGPGSSNQLCNNLLS